MRTNVSIFDINSVQNKNSSQLLKKKYIKSLPDNEGIRLNSSIPTLEKLPQTIEFQTTIQSS